MTRTSPLAFASTPLGRNEDVALVPSETQTSLQQALRTLRAIRLRYEIDRTNSGARLNSVHVSLGCTDMQWVSAAIETLEKAIATGVAPAPAAGESGNQED